MKHFKKHFKGILQKEDSTNPTFKKCLKNRCR